VIELEIVRLGQETIKYKNLEFLIAKRLAHLHFSIGHRANSKFNIREIGWKFKMIFLEHLSSILIGFAWRCSMVRQWLSHKVLLF